MTQAAPLRIFISYAHEDEKILRRLLQHLASLRRQGTISSWHDRCLMPGEEWEASIDQNLEHADIVLLLISASFIDSEYCWGIELKRALERHDNGEARVIPVVARPVDFTGTPFARLQFLPKQGRAISKWSNRDEAYYDIANGIRQLSRQILAEKELALQAKKQARLALLNPLQYRIERLIEENPQDPDVHLLRSLESGEWNEDESAVVASRIRSLMEESGKWKPAYSGTNKMQLKKHHRTLRVLEYLGTKKQADEGGG